jgi:hypothetical protein
MAGHQNVRSSARELITPARSRNALGKKEDFESLASFHSLAIRDRSHYRIIEIL